MARTFKFLAYVVNWFLDHDTGTWNQGIDIWVHAAAHILHGVRGCGAQCMEDARRGAHVPRQCTCYEVMLLNSEYIALIFATTFKRGSGTKSIGKWRRKMQTLFWLSRTVAVALRLRTKNSGGDKRDYVP